MHFRPPECSIRGTLKNYFVLDHPQDNGVSTSQRSGRNDKGTEKEPRVQSLHHIKQRRNRHQVGANRSPDAVSEGRATRSFDFGPLREEQGASPGSFRGEIDAFDSFMLIRVRCSPPTTTWNAFVCGREITRPLSRKREILLSSSCKRTRGK